ncbi:pyridoxamine 5'-phosphate oxidase family protein [Egbenema bharatensis]|uniref:pyridoxamine 5'-phosphate oxidase family protein n=1 Tax=Egbenema bharatensis TaxID=3463334 RepID=UPI003A89DDEA
MTFHPGEIAVQMRAGVREAAERLSPFISDTIKPAALEFLQTQPIAIASTIAENGRVWTSLLSGSPGFIQPLDEQVIQMQAIVPSTDPLHQNLRHDPHLGLLVIDLVNRRRLRLNGIATLQLGSINLQLQQVFFNCPKYIQTRYLKTTIASTSQPPETQTRLCLSESDRHWITSADTFFIATAHSASGADASHRGGYPGFVQIASSDRLLFPDYAGNNMFQTFGNLAVNPNAGLLFIDFDQGHTLQLTGKATVLWDTERMTSFKGAQRLVEFAIEQILETRNATTLRWQFGDYSPANP